MKLADRQGKSLQEIMRSTTSTEFVDWCYFYEQQEIEKLSIHDKDDHYFALLCLKVQQVIEVLCDVKAGARAALKDFLLEFTLSDGTTLTRSTPGEKPKKLKEIDPYKPIEPDEDGKIPGHVIGEPLDDHWKEVNDRAKLAIGAMFGVNMMEEPDGRNGAGT